MHSDDELPDAEPDTPYEPRDKGMAPHLHATVTRLLQRWSAGEMQARDDLASLVQQEMRQLARFQLAREDGRFAPQATSLVNATYLRLLRRDKVSFKNRGHFFGTVSQEMRRVLVDNFRQRSRKKRQGRTVPLEEAVDEAPSRDVDLVRLDDALKDLDAFHATAARIVEMRFFCGLSYEQIAELMELTPKQVRRLWEQARHWLHQELSQDSEP